MNDKAHSNEIPKDQLEEVLKKAQAGSDQALTDLYNAYFERIYTFIFYRVSHKETAEDLTEDVFIKVFNKLRSLSELKAFEGWLFQIARNKVIDYYRSKKELVSLEDIENTLEYETNVVDVVNLQTQQTLFIKLLRELTSEQQQVIKLKFIEDIDNDVIAQMLNKTEGAIRVIQHRAIAKLKELIEHVSNKDTN